MTVLDMYTNSPSAGAENYICKLPVELLIQIFLSAYLTTDQHIRFQLPFNLLSVTSLWRKIVLREPRLWTYTFYGNRWFGPQTAVPVKTISLQLIRSRNLMLEIAIDLKWWCPDDEVVDQLIDVLLQHRNRWVALSLHTNLKDGMMERILRRIPERFPELRELVLQCGSKVNGWTYTRLHKRLLCPKLQVLRLRGTALCSSDLTNSVLPSLSSISLADIQLGWDDWHAVLHHGSKLVELELRNAVIVIGRPGVLGTTPVSLPRLQRLALQLCHCNYAITETVLELDAMIPTFIAPRLHSLLINVRCTGTTIPLEFTWDEAMPGLKTLVILNQGGTDAIRSIFQRCPHISHVNVCNDRIEGHPTARKVLESLVDPCTGPLLDRLDTLTLTMTIPSYEGWEKFFPGKKVQVYINSLFEIATRKRMDRKSLQDREVAIDNLKAVVPLGICRASRDDTWFSNRWRFGGDS
ncbi:hypothetical protein M407DRAFT_17283 [Tulasnella calospora MUT 4182]|uniref:F-box domain-containing protein n=1 Tax=Tulasnella calospora MUT 4182 TaxID=1051891 RepID=A0A0C3LJ25_9AGAM|nr:hypothetical protein M407DRAFT_17283 [Tulasnella calospora MUT 4182]